VHQNIICVPSYEKNRVIDPAAPERDIETLKLIPVPGDMLESIAESLNIAVCTDALAPMAEVASRKGKPNPFPNRKRLPGEKHGALKEDSEEIKGRSNEAAKVTEPNRRSTVIETGGTDTNPRENLQRMLVEASHRVNSPAVAAILALTVESKAPKKLPTIWTNTADEEGKVDEFVVITMGLW
jgi:hypothetical protein